ncbi:MAG: ATP-binding protein [Acidobacteriota bacterium]|nr:ATP-binding protein [Acidobacteriota bacterium]
MSLRTRLRVSILSLVAIVVVAMSALYLYGFTGLAFEAAASRADLIANQIKGYILEMIDKQVLTRGGNPASIDESKRIWTEIVKTDPYVRGLLRRTAANADVVLSIYVAGEDGRILVASSPYLVGMPAPNKLSFREVQQRHPFQNLWDLFKKREDYTTTLPLGVAQQSRPVFAITVVIRSVLLEKALRPAFRNLALVFLGSLLIALILAFFLPNVVLSPLERVSQRIDQIRTGEMEVKPLNISGEAREFKDVQTKLSLLGQQFRGAKQDAIELRNNIEELLQKLEEAVLLFDPSGRVMMAGHPAGRMLGKEGKELIGHNLEELFPKNTILGALIQRAIENHQPVHDQVVNVAAGSSSPARLLVNIERLQKGVGGHEIGTLVTLRDAETRHQLELQLDVSSRLAAITRLTGGIAHEIKNPLNAMALHLEVLKTKLEATEPEIDVISREIQRLDNVVKTFLNFNKPIELQCQPLDLSELTSGLIDLLRPDASARDIAIKTQLTEPMWMNGDPDLMRQAILNVLVNAMDAMKEPGILDVHSECHDCECLLTISDTGHGIPPEIRDKIFNLYFTTKKTGSGMGLAMTFRAVQLHSGTIDVSGEPGQGTTFRLRFPETDAPGRSSVTMQNGGENA